MPIDFSLILLYNLVVPKQNIFINSLTDREKGVRKMPQTILIGYEIKIGTFPNEKTGEMIPYNNRILRFITDVGATSENVGYSPFKVKLKMQEIAKCLNLAANDSLVNDTLNKNLNKEFDVLWSPRDDSMVCVGVRLHPKS